jgi:putative acetyltransferase
MTTPMTIRAVAGAQDIQQVRVLFREYAGTLGFDLCFQNFEQELADLPGHDEPAGCVALRKLTDGVCEMKRLFVRSRHRGFGLGRTLAQHIIREARRLGYTTLRLDTVPSVMDSAIALYRSLGFRDIPPYCFNPVPGALFMELPLADCS